jgi:ribosome-associated heat shock protein Hsp15
MHETHVLYTGTVTEAVASVRIDKWLWAARMFKTRSAASTACTAGHVKIAGESVKSSKLVKPGEHIDVLTPGGPRQLEVVALGDRRGTAAQAQALYIDHTPPPPPKDEFMVDVHRERGAGRPTKKDLRELRRLRGLS